MKLLEARNITKKYNDTPILTDISFSIDEGMIYLIKGRSGGGKSTLLNICSFLEDPDSGEIFFEERSSASMSEKEKKLILRDKIGYIFQDYNLFENLSVYDNMKIYLLATCNMKDAEMDRLIEEKLSLVGLLQMKDRKAKLLSGGERQRVALARVLLLDKKMIYADEPSANIDDGNIAIIKETFARIKENGTSLLVVSHDDVFDEISDRIFILEGGSLHEQE